MNSTLKTPVAHDRRVILSTLWIYLSVNYIYCDHLGIMETETIKGLLTGYIGTIHVTQKFLLAAALLMQIPFLMIVLSRILQLKANRISNMIAAILMIIVQIGTMGMGTSLSWVYLFYSVIVIVCNLIIVRIAWKWTNPKNNEQLTSA